MPPDADKVTSPNAERTTTSFSCIANSLKFELWPEITKKEEWELQLRYSIKSLGKEGSWLYHSPSLSGEIIQRELLDEIV